ncbi:MAG TPA: 2-amino-4-hydroxy-6-hydroxymethyldihydropteridine diphosphokinase [Bacteroidia bacterium]|nr:2-amino-4-hydroxy-6-hydroxymethyldihydropteridine diphosphokinase [Bacteroidia bacterium]MBP7714583.1 2-amino-4-hydroxy-6-hydroxymethyldihydropteridine diphosphokinase [Bacteroidia bacterium]MBP8667890.1 2-amino-4-hydroxy-6-hydroxymethyldihydropteridine diphosphokinase [Bacteroidia bacterium]HOZ81396.1 2-amino-4-hydroxy-6-hydroxymethyldihydropteridine diphosphokinase [Bacteroidia bacterium]HQW16928.1 2-amino-4-hydroxy-6-hydroxymethyldihydropteridine diphosphokinase [Bacteroidia bacterium]
MALHQNTAIILAGSNLGNRLHNLTEAALFLQRLSTKKMASSSVYESAPWGNQNQPPFLNQAFSIYNAFTAHELLDVLLTFEKSQGRTRKHQWEPRSIDLDILFFNNEIICTPELTVPHKHLHERRFVLEPLAELISDFIHPVFKKSISELLVECKDDLKVSKYPLYVQK